MDAKELKTLKKKNKIRESKTDYIYYAVCGFILFLLAVIIIYPLYYIVIASVSDPSAVVNGEVWLYPVRLTFSGYANLFNRPDVWRGYFNTLVYTLAGTAFNIVLTIPAGWALSRDYLPFRRVIMPLLIITMFFGGGLVPYIAVCTALGLYQNPLIMVLGGGVSVYNVFMCKSFFQTNVPKEVLEAAQIDGAGKMAQMRYVVIPSILSTVVIMLIMKVGSLLSVGYEKVYLMSNSDNYAAADIVATLSNRWNDSGNTTLGIAAEMGNNLIGMILVLGANAVAKRAADVSLY